MSVYVTRYYEVRVPIIDADVSNIEELKKKVKPDKDGFVCHVSCNSYDTRYMCWSEKKQGWIPKKDVKHKWVLVRWYNPAGLGYNRTHYDFEVGKIHPNVDPYTKESDTKVVKEGEKLDEGLYYCDNGSIVRDEYLSSHFNSTDCDFRERGYPSDMSEELRFYLKSVDDKYLWGKTYVTLSEWNNEYHRQLEKFKSKLNDLYSKKNADKTNEKLDDILKMLSGEKVEKKKKKNSDDEENEINSSIDYLWEEKYYDLMYMRNEITRAYVLTEYFGYTPDEDIRIIYNMG